MPNPGVSSTVTITAWTVAVLIVLQVTATSCKCCAPCKTIGTAIWDLLNCFFGGLWSLCKCLVGTKKSEPTEVKENKRKLVEQRSMRKRFCRGNAKMGNGAWINQLAPVRQVWTQLVSVWMTLREC